MERLSVIKHNGKEIIFVNLSKMGAQDIDEVTKLLEEEKKMMAAGNTKNSKLSLADISEIAVNNDFLNVIKDAVRHNVPFVKKGALIGIGGIKEVFFKTFKTTLHINGNNYMAFDTIEEAKDWLTKE